LLKIKYVKSRTKEGLHAQATYNCYENVNKRTNIL